jgi:23S rRNA pseudouridine2605 synthase
VSIRLNKLLAQRGLGARRKCDDLIRSGVVRVGGEVVTEPGTQVEPERDRVTVSGRPLAVAAAPRYFVLNKPVGVITTLDDPEGRRTVRELLPPGSRLFPVGRLDADTSGLLILTNDGELAHHLMHPRYGVEKVYRARMEQVPTEGALRRLREGVEFEPGIWSSPARVRVLVDEPGDSMIEITLHEGRHRQVRRMCEAVGVTVRSLHRSAYGPLRLGPVQRGMWRELSDEEVRRLRVASARPRPRGQVGYDSPRGRGDAPRRLARRLDDIGARPVKPREPGAGPAPARPIGRSEEAPYAPPRASRASSGEPRTSARGRPAAGTRSAAPQGRPAAGTRSAAPQGRPAAGPRSAAPRGRPAAGPRGAAPRSRLAAGPRGAAPRSRPAAGPRGAAPRGRPAASARSATPRGRPAAGRPGATPRGRSGGRFGIPADPRRLGEGSNPRRARGQPGQSAPRAGRSRAGGPRPRGPKRRGGR